MFIHGRSPGTPGAAGTQLAVRPPALAGRSYERLEPALRNQLARYFVDPDGSGPLPPPRPHGRLRGVLSPHIDFQRGGPTYTWAYRELLEKSNAEVFVILGVAHQPAAQRFVLTRKDFDTPIGVLRTDREYVDRIASHAGLHLFDDEPVHRHEHSIEFQAVFLRYVLGQREATIVPILVGSFHDLMVSGRDPMSCDEVRRFIEALHAAEAACPKRVAYIGGVDFSHIGPEFGDPEPVSDAMLEMLARHDLSMIDRAVANDPAGWFETAARSRNRSRICGLAATYTTLQAMGPARGKLLQYRQSIDHRRTCCVSFASLVFEADDDSAPS